MGRPGAALSTVIESARRDEKPLSASAALPPAMPVEELPRPLGCAASGADDSSPGTRRRGPLIPSRDYIQAVVDLIRQAAEAAHALHEQGIVHRDIKPGNIMVTADGQRAVLMDLGLAQLADEDEGRLTRTRQFVGTLRYASPEQVLAAAALDCRTDVYSLGASLWELLALRPLFGATEATPTPELMQQILLDEPERLARLVPALPRDLEAIIHRALEKKPESRYASARDLAADLGRFLRAANPSRRARRFLGTDPQVGPPPASRGGANRRQQFGSVGLGRRWRRAALQRTAPSGAARRPTGKRSGPKRRWRMSTGKRPGPTRRPSWPAGLVRLRRN